MTQRSLLPIALLVLLGNFIFSGTVYGWASLQIMLEEEGVFSAGCSAQELHDNECTAQADKLSLMYSIGSTMNGAASILTGLLVDMVGPTRANIVDMGIVIFGLVALASATANSWLFFVAYALVGLGGNLFYLNSFRLAFVIDAKNRVRFLSTVNCLYDASAVVFYFFFLIHKHTSADRRVIFISFATFSAVVFVSLTFAWWALQRAQQKKAELETTENMQTSEVVPTDAVTTMALSPRLGTTAISPRMGANTFASGSPTMPTKQHFLSTPEQQMRHQNKANTNEQSQTEPNAHTLQLTIPPLHDELHQQQQRQSQQQLKQPSSQQPLTQLRSLKQQFKSFEFVALLSLALVGVSHSTVYLGTTKILLESLGDKATGYLYTQIFVLSLPLSLVFVQPISWFMGRYGFAASFGFIQFLGFVVGVLSMIPVLELQVVTFCFYNAYRAFFYGCISIYASHALGPHTVGRVFGTALSVSCGFSFLLWPALVLTNKYANGNLVYLNGALAISHILVIPVILKLGKRIARDPNADVVVVRAMGSPAQSPHGEDEEERTKKGVQFWFNRVRKQQKHESDLAAASWGDQGL